MERVEPVLGTIDRLIADIHKSLACFYCSGTGIHRGYSFPCERCDGTGLCIKYIAGEIYGAAQNANRAAWAVSRAAERDAEGAES